MSESVKPEARWYLGTSKYDADADIDRWQRDLQPVLQASAPGWDVVVRSARDEWNAKSGDAANFNAYIDEIVNARTWQGTYLFCGIVIPWDSAKATDALFFEGPVVGKGNADLVSGFKATKRHVMYWDTGIRFALVGELKRVQKGGFKKWARLLPVRGQSR